MSSIQHLNSVMAGNLVMRDQLIDQVRNVYNGMASGSEGGSVYLLGLNLLGLYTPMSLGGGAKALEAQDLSMMSFFMNNPALAANASKTVAQGSVKALLSMFGV